MLGFYVRNVQSKVVVLLDQLCFDGSTPLVCVTLFAIRVSESPNSQAVPTQ